MDDASGLDAEWIEELQNEARDLRHALEQSVRTQAQYAGLLNSIDGGRRLQYATADEWMAWLRAFGYL